MLECIELRNFEILDRYLSSAPIAVSSEIANTPKRQIQTNKTGYYKTIEARIYEHWNQLAEEP